MTKRIKIIFLSLFVLFFAFFTGYLKVKQSSNTPQTNIKETITLMKDRVITIAAEVNENIIEELEKENLINNYNCKGIFKNVNNKISVIGPLKDNVHPISLEKDDIVSYDFCLGNRMFILSKKDFIENSENKKVISAYVDMKNKNPLPQIVLSPLDIFLEGL